MNRRSGFTLIELAVVVTIAGILAAAAIAWWQSAVKNAASGDAAFDVGARLEGLRAASMRDGTPYVAVILDAVGNDASRCGGLSAYACTGICILGNPPAFDVGTWAPSWTNEGCTFYRNGVRFDRASAARRLPAPFDTFTVNDPAVVKAVGGRDVLAFRFLPNGRVQPELPGGVAPPPNLNGVAVAIGSNATAAQAVRAVVVTFPYGMVRTFGL